MDSLNALELSDVQAIVVRGYGNLPDAFYLLLHVDDPESARRCLERLSQEATFADYKPDTVALNMALTVHGLEALGVPENIIEGFSDEFRSGMHTPHKRRILGDEGENAPENWDWGGPENPPVDILLLCYAASAEVLEASYERIKADCEANGMTEIARLDTKESVEFKEHFGFRDSISQPYFAEFDSHNRTGRNPVPLGEILLGYPNGYERLTQRPLVEAAQDPEDLLSPVVENTQSGEERAQLGENDSQPGEKNASLKDLGRNGTYLVFRQLAQDVRTFWQFMRDQAASASNEDAVRLAAKMVGRWPSGAPLVLAPDADAPELEDKDNFAYHQDDAQGLKCPFGAHVRRTHPRDFLEPDPGTQTSVDFSNRHRLLRRGRTYGAPFHPSMLPEDMLEHLDARGDEEWEDESRGLHFICLNANIGRQFEFVQHTWANNPTFAGLYHDPDPLIGPRSAFGVEQNHFTLPSEPVRCQVCDLPDFVRVRGGGYFFLPGRQALTFLLRSPGAGKTVQHH